jgi:hypothetical protein
MRCWWAGSNERRYPAKRCRRGLRFQQSRLVNQHLHVAAGALAATSF